MIPYEHLLNVPWSSLNCSAVARIAMNGWLSPDGTGFQLSGSDLPTTEAEGHEAFERARSGKDAIWEDVGMSLDDAEIGDLVFTVSDRGPHVGLVVDDGLYLSSNRRRGVFAAPLRTVRQSLRGIFRLNR